MTIRVTDQHLFRELSIASRAVTLEGPDGEPLGTFTPGPADPDWREMGISEEEYQRRVSDTRPGYTTEQVLAHLRGLRCTS